MRWVWKRQGLTYTPEYALTKAKDKELIEFYKNGNRKGFDKKFIEACKKLDAMNDDLIGDLYLTVNNYAERCLIFDIEKDVRQTFFGLKKQAKRKQKQHLQIIEKVL